MNFLRFLLFSFLFFTAQAIDTLHNKFCVIGFGPAGILSACTLIDLGAKPEEIRVIDTDLCGGRFGKYYQDVRLITNNKHNARYLSSTPTMALLAHDYLEKTAYCPEALPLIGEFVAALKNISMQLFELGVHPLRATARSIDGEHGAWRITTDNVMIECEYIVLALGWRPIQLHYDNLEEISLDFALTPDTLAPFLNSNDRVAVFGDGKSAQLAVQTLRKLGITEILSVVPANHFAAQGALYCARYNDTELLTSALQHCNKVIYAIGFEENTVELMTTELKDFFATKDRFMPGIVRVAEQGVVGIMLSIQETFAPWLAMQEQ